MKVYGMALALLAAGCAGPTVKRDYDPAMDFGSLKTYAWSTGNAAAPFIDARVRPAVDDALAAKGFRPGDGAADMRAAFDYTVQTESEDDRARTGVGLGGGTGGVFGGVNLGIGLGKNTREMETLTITFLDPGTGKPLWQGSSRNVKPADEDPERSAARLQKIVQAILKNFPPAPRGGKTRT